MTKNISYQRERTDSIKQRRQTKGKTFEILAMVTTRAGKTSFINALVGQELLHITNEATTACTTSIEYCSGSEHFNDIWHSHTNRELAHQQNISVALTHN